MYILTQETRNPGLGKGSCITMATNKFFAKHNSSAHYIHFSLQHYNHIQMKHASLVQASRYATFLHKTTLKTSHTYALAFQTGHAYLLPLKSGRGAPSTATQLITPTFYKIPLHHSLQNKILTR